ncbi:hypothetical protein L6164_012762 [Bauhinia variegata]|uniref:Uncharacterized protein n=1 Tax=Bauhinia variegata TaxID=167791 RepID=A0ACB9PCA8_BAUVA|nr:hypothetical protein L6164_012762 [Bauhinia variegata]
MAVKPLLLLCFLLVASLSVSSASDRSTSEESEQPSDRRLPIPRPWKWGPDRKPQENPFHFPNQLFQTRYRNEHGHIRTLPRFDSNNRNLRGIANYRLLEFQARPQTFVLPHHSDAEYLVYVVSGKALFTIIVGSNRESYNLESDYVIRIPAGATAYVANRDDNQNLRIVKLVIPVNNDGQFEDFFPVGQQNPRSYYYGFRRRTLEAAFNSPYQEILRALLGQQSQALVRATREQIRQLSQNARSSQEAGQTRLSPFNVRNFENPNSNNYARFWEVHPNQVPQLQDLDVCVTFMVLNRGSLVLPHVNSRTWVVAYISQGTGEFEIAAPEREQGQEEQEGQEQERSYGEIQGLSSQLNEGDVFVVPPGYPFALTSSNDNNMEIVGFNINIQGNERSYLAGESENMIAQIDSVAKELTFSGSAQQVQRLFKSQGQSYFASAQPQQQQQQQQQGGESGYAFA